VLVSATDGVGTKLKIAFMTGIHDTVGIDLVAMNVNDILVSGAEPLFFLDYFATGRISPETFRAVVSGIANGCEQAGCALIGGETAEMPDFYGPGEYDLAGFCVGMVDGLALIDGSKMKPGDVVIGLASSGLHSNGYSLVRKVFIERKAYELDKVFPDLGKPLGEELLTPTAIYVRPVLETLKTVPISAMAHITGGGFQGNIPRVVPGSCSVRVSKGSWEPPAIFSMLGRDAGLDDTEMFRTFNMGIGMVLTVPPEHASRAQEILAANNTRPLIIGEVEDRPRSGEAIVLE
jgi:phosphoribosylformylglycinamidine cyclo-ligase